MANDHLCPEPERLSRTVRAGDGRAVETWQTEHCWEVFDLSVDIGLMSEAKIVDWALSEMTSPERTFDSAFQSICAYLQTKLRELAEIG